MASPRPLPFILAATDHGTMIVNRNDVHQYESHAYGVGYQLLNHGCYDPQEVQFALALLSLRHKIHGEGVMAIDCGANIGVHTVEWGKHMHGWGEVIAFEAQEKIYYALAGNVILNNCLNVCARHSAVGASCGSLEIPEPDYLIPSSYGSFELKQRTQTEFIGQTIDYGKTRPVSLVSLDSLALTRVDMVKIDVEGMEEEVLSGAQQTIERHHPIMMIEIIKSDQYQIRQDLQQWGYQTFPMGMNILAIHQEDPACASVHLNDGMLVLTP